MVLLRVCSTPKRERRRTDHNFTALAALISLGFQAGWLGVEWGKERELFVEEGKKYKRCTGPTLTCPASPFLGVCVSQFFFYLFVSRWKCVFLPMRVPCSLCALFLPFDPAWQIASRFALALWQEVALQAPRSRRSATENSGKGVGGSPAGGGASITSPHLY